MVIGLPLNMDGSEGFQATRTRKFYDVLAKRLPENVGIDLWDERLTTIQAQRALIEGNVRREARKARVDKVAAAILLQSYLDHRRNAAG